MNVLFAGLKYDYGKEENGLSVEYTNFYDALRRMPGVEAEFFAIDEHTVKLGYDAANQLLINTVKERQFDLVFFYLLSEEFKKETIKQVTGLTKTFNWFADDHWRVPVYSRFWAPLFSLASTTDPNAIELYKSYGITNVVKSQWGANQYLYSPCEPQKNPGDLDVTFVGKKFGNRPNYIRALVDAELPVKAFGSGWSLGRISQEKMMEVFSYSKINLNFSETYFVGAKANLKLLGKLFVTKEGGRYKFVGHYLPNNLKAAWGTKHLCIKGRVFEVPACGGFMLTGKMDDDITEYYVPGKEIVVFESVSDMVEKCGYYLEHELERDKIAKEGYARTMRDHTYAQRFRDIFKHLDFNL